MRLSRLVSFDGAVAILVCIGECDLGRVSNSTKPNLVPRVLRLFGQRVDASRDSGIMEKFNFFDWSSA